MGRGEVKAVISMGRVRGWGGGEVKAVISMGRVRG